MREYRIWFRVRLELFEDEVAHMKQSHCVEIVLVLMTPSLTIAVGRALWLQGTVGQVKKGAVHLQVARLKHNDIGG